MDRPGEKISTGDAAAILLAEESGLLRQLREAAGSLDVETVRTPAIRLEALAESIGARWLADLCHCLELSARHNDLAHMDEQVRLIEIAHERVRYALRKRRRASSPRSGTGSESVSLHAKEQPPSAGSSSHSPTPRTKLLWARTSRRGGSHIVTSSSSLNSGTLYTRVFTATRTPTPSR